MQDESCLHQEPYRVIKCRLVFAMTNSTTSPYTWKLLLATLTNNLMCVAYGSLCGYSSPALPDMNRHPNPFRLSADQQSWIGSVTALGAAIGALFCGTLADHLGRKLAMMTSALFIILTFTLNTTATGAGRLLVGSFLYGFFGIMPFTASNLYVSEISPTRIRGRLTTTNSTFSYALGMLLIYVAGAVVPWNWLAIFVATLFAIPAIILVLLPESPRWLLLKGHREEAIDSFEWFRAADVRGVVMEEVRIVEESLNEIKDHRCSSWIALLEPENFKCLVICSVAYIIQAFCGVMVLQIFTMTIFEMAAPSLNSNSNNVQPIVTGLFFFLGSFVCPLVVESTSRRCLFFVSTSVVSVCMAATGIFFLVEEHNSIFARQQLGWLPVVALSLSTFSYAIGLDPVPNLLSCELFPTKVRGNVQTVTNFINGLAFFTCLSSFAILRRVIHVSGAFFVYASVCAAGTYFSLYVLKEPGKDVMR